MNKSYRVVWNEVRDCLMVVGDHAKSKGKPHATRTALAAAIGALFLVPGAAFAQCVGENPVSTALTAPQCYSDVNVAVQNTGSIIVNSTSGGVTAAYVSASPYTSTFTNSGTIRGIAGSGYSAQAYGLYFDGDFAGTLTNSGTINGTSTAGSSYAQAYGLYVSGELSGAISNLGTLSGNAAANSSGYGYGLYISNSVTSTGSLANSGTISGTASGGSSGARAYGVYVSGNLDGSLTNTSTGTIRAEATSNDNQPRAYAVYVDSTHSGMLSNAGNINAIASNGATGYGVAWAYGVYFNSFGATGTLTNSGTISATASAAGNSAYAYAYGVYVSNGIEGTLTNSGTINATATNSGTGSGSMNAYGIYASSGIVNTGVLTNSGMIGATATGGSAGANAAGVDLGYSGLDGALTNTSTGSISATATSSNSSANAYGIRSNSDLNGSLANAGAISANATYGGTGYGTAGAYGVQVSTISGTGTLTNSGTITANATAANGTSAYAYAYGVRVSGNLDGTLTNTGTISATANGANGGTAAGVYISSDLNGTLTNSGTIRGTGLGGVSSSNAYSVYANGGSGTINNLAGGLLEGTLYAGGSVNVNNAGTIDTRLGASTVGGNYTQSATGVLAIGATDNATFGTLNVGGTATFAAGTGLRVNAAAGHTLAAGTLAGVVTTGGLSFSSATVADSILPLNFTAAANGNNIDLNAAATGLTSVAAALANGTDTGSVFDSLLANVESYPGELKDFLYSLGSASTAQEVADSIAKVSPAVANAVAQVAAGASRGVNNVVLARLEGIQGRATGNKFYSDGRAWVKPFGSWADQDDRRGVIGYDATTIGIVGGVDADVGSASRLGVAFGYARSDVDGNSSVAPQNTKIDTYQAVFYGSHRLDKATEVNFQAGVGMHDNKGRRDINIGGPTLVASAKYSGWSANLGAGIAHTIKWTEKTSFTPSLRADYSSLRNKSYSESGAGALNLNVNSNDTGQFIVGVDGKITHALSGKSTLVANVGLGYDLIDDRSSVTSAFAGAPAAAFSTQGIESSRWLVRGGVGAVFRASERTEVTARYDVEGRTSFINQTASVKVRWAF